MPTEHIKDPADKLDYTFDWTKRLATGDTILTEGLTVTTEAGLTVSDVSESAGIVTYWLAGGTVNKTYPVVCHVATAAGRIMEWTTNVQILDK